MPCFQRERSLQVSCRRDKSKVRDDLFVKPVHPRSIRFHGFFGEPLVRQHLMMDERWSPDSLGVQFAAMTDLLSSHAVYKRLDSNAIRQRMVKESKRLKLECRNGRTKLRNVVMGNNIIGIRNLLVNHKDMQRLYQRMPIHQVVDNINQRTFVMRKERDRLECRLANLKLEYKEKLMHRSVLENRIKYQNEYILDEEVRSIWLTKRIENTHTRLKAIKAINTAYHKMMQVLQHDSMFYDPILRSLDDDMEDQSNFIKHILHLGTPAISKFKELKSEYEQLEEKTRKAQNNKIQVLETLKAAAVHKPTIKDVSKAVDKISETQRYLRETRSMLMLKKVFKVLESVIKELKFNTLCSQAREIYPRMQDAIHRNRKFERLAEFEEQARYAMEDKMKCACSLQSILANNLGREEIERLKNIHDLKKELADANKFEEDTMEHMKQRAHAFILMRWSLWNFIQILNHVGRNPIVYRIKYPNSYLDLPLLKFEMLNMYAVPPELYEVDIMNILSVLKNKVYTLTKAYEAKKQQIEKTNGAVYREKYHVEYISTRLDVASVSNESKQRGNLDDILVDSNKVSSDVPSRRQIKAKSAKEIEQALKILNS